MNGFDLGVLEREEKARIAHEYAQKAEDVCQTMKQVEWNHDIESVAKAFKRVQNCDKMKRDLEKKVVEEKKNKREERFATTQQNNKLIKGDLKNKFSYLKEKDVQRTRLISEIKDAI